MCGETAGDVTVTRLLLGLEGCPAAPMHPARILAVKQEVLRANTCLAHPGPSGYWTATVPIRVLAPKADAKGRSNTSN